MDDTFEKLLHTTVDIGSLGDYRTWLNITFDEAKNLQLNLHKRRERGEPDEDLEDFVSGKIASIKDARYNFERALQFDGGLPSVPMLTGEAAKEFIEKAQNPKKVEVTEQQIKMYQQMQNQETFSRSDIDEILKGYYDTLVILGMLASDPHVLSITKKRVLSLTATFEAIKSKFWKK